MNVTVTARESGGRIVGKRKDLGPIFDGVKMYRECKEKKRCLAFFN